MDSRNKLRMALRELEEVLEQQIAYHAKSWKVVCAIRGKLGLVSSWILRTRRSGSLVPLATELCSGIGKALDVYVPDGLNDEMDMKAEAVHKICKEIVRKNG